MNTRPCAGVCFRAQYRQRNLIFYMGEHGSNPEQNAQLFKRDLTPEQIAEAQARNEQAWEASRVARQQEIDARAAVRAPEAKQVQMRREQAEKEAAKYERRILDAAASLEAQTGEAIPQEVIKFVLGLTAELDKQKLAEGYYDEMKAILEAEADRIDKEKLDKAVVDAERRAQDAAASIESPTRNIPRPPTEASKTHVPELVVDQPLLDSATAHIGKREVAPVPTPTKKTVWGTIKGIFGR
jgi:hypothetical protein